MNWIIEHLEQKGEKVAELIIKKKDETLKILPLYAAEDLKKVNFLNSLLFLLQLIAK